MTTGVRRILYAAVVFWSALLLLLVQPILAKSILPWFGGSAGVWTTSMLFFQTVLLLGYFYAHWLNRALPVKAQVAVHATLLVLAVVVFLPLHPSDRWKPTGEGDPVFLILGLLFSTAGLPYFLLSSTSPLLQAWYSRTFHTEVPWRLFALSNLGSLISLLAYPVLLEPNWAVTEQLALWSGGFIVFAALCGTAAFLSGRESQAHEPGEMPAMADMLIWVALAAVPSVLWLAMANKMSVDVAAVPFLWVLPLSIYLLSFVLTFDSDRWYHPKVFRFLLPAAWVMTSVVISQQGVMDIWWIVGLYATALFLCCMFCHGELARLKPAPRQLTAFYLTMSAGGALGGLFVALVAPRMFTDYWELPIGLVACILLALWLLYSLSTRRVVMIGATVAAGAIAALTVQDEKVERQINMRNFYGLLQVKEDGQAPDHRYRAIYNGKIQHGLQFLAPNKSRIATTYYGEASGAAIALRYLMAKGPVRVGVIGLGAGTMAAWGREGDYYRFYDINPDVVRLAQTEFRYLRESPAKSDIVLGDARLSLEREEPQKFNLLVVDAFSGDSIPVHLLTREAFQLYFRHLQPGGVIAVHVTNKHLDLAPVAKLEAHDQRAKALLIINSPEDEREINGSDWVLVTKSDEIDARLSYLSSPIRGSARIRLWTDDYSNLFTILKAQGN